MLRENFPQRTRWFVIGKRTVSYRRRWLLGGCSRQCERGLQQGFRIVHDTIEQWCGVRAFGLEDLCSQHPFGRAHNTEHAWQAL